MKLLIFLASSIFAVNSAAILGLDLEEWQAFKREYGKTYADEAEEEYRMKIFTENKKEIEEHNARYRKGEETFKMGVNKFSDLLFTEVHQMLNSRGDHRKAEMFRGSTFIPPANVELPAEVNWVKRGAVTRIKDQGYCGSSYAFSATGALEGQVYRKTGVLISLSEQNFLDCSPSNGNCGCFGGHPSLCYFYVKENGIDSEISYPYLGSVFQCRYNATNSITTASGFVDVRLGDEDALKAAVATMGPLSAVMNGSHRSFIHYTGGIYNKCIRDSNLDHFVLVVGYGTDNETKQDYWLVKNSWGNKWGEEGYFRLVRNVNNICGIASDASYPLL